MCHNLEPIGRIVRLQVQTAHLKQGTQPRRWYDPAPITDVTSLLLDEGGVTGIASDGTTHHDVHHRDHPISRNRGDNGISIGFTSHYAAMRERFGTHISDGVAGENILVDSGALHTEEALAGRLVIETAAGIVRLEQIIAAPPCVEFTRFCMRWPPDLRPDRTVTEGLQFLGAGMRGFYAALAPDANAGSGFAIGDMVFRGIEP